MSDVWMCACWNLKSILHWDFSQKTFLGYDCSYYVRFMGDVRPPIGKHMAWQTSTWGACCKIVNGRGANHRYRCHFMKIRLAQLEWKFVPHNIIWIQFTLTRNAWKFTYVDQVLTKCWLNVAFLFHQIFYRMQCVMFQRPTNQSWKSSYYA